MDVTQTANRTVINWNTFNVGSQAHVNFAQPSASSATLNRALDTNPSQIKAMFENKGAVLAPGGLIILSARAVDRLQGGVVKNSGWLDVTGMAMRGGKIVLYASDRIESTGTINANANAGTDVSPTGNITFGG